MNENSFRLIIENERLHNSMQCSVLHVSGDKKLATQIATELCNRGIDASALDSCDFTKSEHLADGVKKAVVLLSPQSMGDESFNASVARADYTDVDLYTVRISGADFSDNLRFFLQWSQWLDLSSNDGVEIYDFLAQTVLSGKPLDQRNHPQTRRLLRKKIMTGAMLIALVAALAGGGILWRLYDLTRQAERQAAARAEALLRPPAGFSLAFSPRSGNPWIADPRITLYFNGVARQTQGVEVGLYEPSGMEEKNWSKTAEFRGLPQTGAGYQSIETPIGKKPEQGKLCFIYGRDLGVGLLRRQYGIFDLKIEAEHIALNPHQFGVLEKSDINCDALMQRSVDRSPLAARLWQQRLLDLAKTHSYLAPYGVKESKGTGLFFATLGLGGGTLPPPDATLYVYKRKDGSVPWAALARLDLAKAYATVERVRPNELLVCIDTRLVDSDLHIGVAHHYVNVDDAYKLVENMPAQLGKSKSPCLAYFHDDDSFAITTEVNWPEFILPEGSGWRGDLTEPQAFQLGQIHIGQPWAEAIETANEMLSGIIRRADKDQFENLMTGLVGNIFRGVLDGVGMDKIAILISDNDHRGIALMRNPRSDKVAAIFYAVRPSIREYSANSEAFGWKVWQNRVSAAFGRPEKSRRTGNLRSNSEFAASLWNTTTAPCVHHRFARVLDLEPRLTPPGCTPHAGVLLHRQYDNVSFIAWAVGVHTSNMISKKN
ncbi:MAG: type 4b pilus protein PilO2 [Rhizobiaceae bacterium]